MIMEILPRTRVGIVHGNTPSGHLPRVWLDTGGRAPPSATTNR